MSTYQSQEITQKLNALTRQLTHVFTVSGTAFQEAARALEKLRAACVTEAVRQRAQRLVDDFKGWHRSHTRRQAKQRYPRYGKQGRGARRRRARSFGGDSI